MSHTFFADAKKRKKSAIDARHSLWRGSCGTDHFICHTGNPDSSGARVGGNLYVITGTEIPEVRRYNSGTGAFIDRFVTFDIGEGKSSPIAITFGLDDNLYVSSFFTGEIKWFNGTTGASIGTFVAPGSGPPEIKP